MSFRRKPKKDENKIDYTKTLWTMPELEPLPKLPPKPPPSPPPPSKAERSKSLPPQKTAPPPTTKPQPQSKLKPSLNPFDDHYNDEAAAAQAAAEKAAAEEAAKRHELALQKQRESISLQKSREAEYTQVQNQLSETIQTSHATCTQLDSQKEQLVHTATLVEHTGDVVNQSKRLLRGMTWGGWIQNKFSNNEGSSSSASFNGAGSSRRNLSASATASTSSASIGPGGLAASAASTNGGPPDLFASFRKNGPPFIPPPTIDYQKYTSSTFNTSSYPQSTSILHAVIATCGTYRTAISEDLPACETIPELTFVSTQCKTFKKEVWESLKQYQQLKSFQEEKKTDEKVKSREEKRKEAQEQKFYKDIIKEVDVLEAAQVKMEKYVRGTILKGGGKGHSSPALLGKKPATAPVAKKSVENVPGPTRKSFSAAGSTTKVSGGGQRSLSMPMNKQPQFSLEELEEELAEDEEDEKDDSSNNNNKTPKPKPNKHTTNRNELFAKFPLKKHSSEQLLDQNVLTEQALQKQDEHLSILSAGLTELQSVNSTINVSIKEQNKMLEQIGDDADLYRHDMKVLVRKADRMRNGMSWSLSSKRPYFQYNVSLRHIPTGKYLTTTTTTNNKNRGILYLSSKCHPFGSVFELYKKGNESNKKPVSSSLSKRSLTSSSQGDTDAETTTTTDFGGQGAIVGFKNKRSGKWLGLAFWSGGKKNIVCYADRFGRREEWELEEGEGLKKAKNKGNMNIEQADNSTIVTLINASANFGNGGYLETKGFNDKTSDTDVSLTIGVAEVRGKRTAALWAIEKRDDVLNDATVVTASQN